MAAESLFESLADQIVTAIEDALAEKGDALPALDPPDMPGARTAMNALKDRARQITDAGDPGQWVDAMNDWADTLDDLAQKAFGGPDPLDSLIARVMEERMPRTAAFLMLVGIIVPQTDGRDRIDWPKAQQFFTDPGTLVNEELWDALLGDASIPGTGRLPAIIIGTLLLAPQAILGLARGDLRVAPVLPPPTDAPGAWRTFRERTESWISLTIPIGDPAAPAPAPRNVFDWRDGLRPDISATLAMKSDRTPAPGGSRTVFELWLALTLEDDLWRYPAETDSGDGWYVKIEPGISFGFGYDGAWHGAFRQMLTNDSLVPGPSDPVTATFGRETPDGVPDLILGPPYDTRIVIRDLSAFLKVREDHPIFEIGASVHDFSLVLTNRWWRTFGVTDELFREGIRLDLDIYIAYLEGRGVRLNLGAGLDVTFNIDKELGKKSFVGMKLHSVRLYVPLRAAQDSLDVRAEVTFHVSIKVGPATVVVDGLGGWLRILPWEAPWVGFLPPTGAGLQISYAGVTGGGFLEWGRQPNLNDRFAGLAHLNIFGFEVTAFGIHELTGDPGDPERKTSFILVIGVRFTPGVQLGFGFAITGFGGLVGINRRADTDLLRERLTSGAAGNILFAEDPVRNAPEILGDLQALFPATDGVYVFGPTVQVSWLKIGSFTIFQIDAGIFFEVTESSLTKVVLLGSVRATIPDLGEDVPKLLQLRFDIVGIVDFPKRTLEVDATLIKSSALYAFHLTGDLAFRVSWGDRPHMLLSFGGFHPRFDPKPAQFPDLTRLALTLRTSFAGLHFRAEAYLAITSNTIQFGARIEVGYKLGPFNLTGFLALDAIIQFSPFWFEIAISVGVKLRWNGSTLCGVRLEGTLSGPGPFTISGKACIEVLFFEICASATIPIGPRGAPAAPPSTSSTAQALQPEIGDPDNLASDGGEDRLAQQRMRPSLPGAKPVISPLGRVIWTQKRAPLGVTLDRFEGQPLALSQRVVANSPMSQGETADWFAPGSFMTLSESEALTRPGFERLCAGLTLSASPLQSTPLRHTVEVIEVRLPKKISLFHVVALEFPAITLASAAARTAPAAVHTTAAKIEVGDERFVVRSPDGAQLEGELPVSEAHQRARQYGGVAVASADLVQLGGV